MDDLDQGRCDVAMFGAREYSMRIWLDPYKLEQYQLMPADVRSAIERQNVQVSAGQLGQLPSVAGQMLNVPIQARGKLQTAAQFENIILKSSGSGATVRIKDVARVELAAESADVQNKLNGRNAGALAIVLAAGVWLPQPLVAWFQAVARMLG